MGRLVYSAIASLDGYVADADGRWDWAFPDAEVHAFANELERPIRTHLFGRRMYEVMTAWETVDLSDEPEEMHDFAALWHASDKIVFSTTLDEVTTARTRLEREFRPELVAQLKADTPDAMAIGGPGLAAHALAAGLVDELHLILFPVIVGGGTAAMPDDLRLDLELLGQRRFACGAVALHYAVSAAPS